MERFQMQLEHNNNLILNPGSADVSQQYLNHQLIGESRILKMITTVVTDEISSLEKELAEKRKNVDNT